MKRFIVVMIDTDDLDTQTIQTDDVRATVVSILDLGYDIICDIDEGAEELTYSPEGIDDIVSTLFATKKWAGEDGARSLILIDTQKIDTDTIAQ